MQQMMQNIQIIHNNIHKNHFTPDRGRGRGRGCGRFQPGRGRGRGREPNRNHTNEGSYCHTHGNCNHIGTECNTPSENHQAAATFTNMMGGSTNRCYWITN